MNWVDVVIIVGAVAGAIVGFRQGLILSVFSFLGLVVGVVVAGVASDALAEKLSSSGALWASAVSFIVILLAVIIIFNIVGHVIKGFIKLIMLGWLDSLGGAIIGLFVGALMIAAIFIALGKWAAGQPGTTSIGEAISNSTLAEFLIDSFQFLLLLLPERFNSVKNFFA